MQRILIIHLLICLSIPMMGQKSSLNWMPVPKSWEHNGASYRLSADFKVGIESYSNQRLESYATRFLRRLDQRTGLFFRQDLVTPEAVDPNLIINVKREGQVAVGENESYQLTISEDRIKLTAETDLGAMRGLETLLQVVSADKEGYYFEGLTVSDAPRFPWRGLMIDVSRHFQPVDVIKRNLDGMASVKMNVLHLHLVDDHGFRVESKVYPQLNEKASRGEYYSQEQIREIIHYAAARGIRVVPEFDVPGHASAFLTAFPELGSAPGPYHLQNRSGIFDPTLNPTIEETYEFLNNLFTEMAALFPDTYFHIGGDENEGKHWMANESIQAFMKENGFNDIHELQNYFVTRIQSHLKSLNKKVVGWDEILTEDLPRDAVIHSWRGVESLKIAAQQGYQCILSNGFYIDLMKRASDHYLTDPLPKGLQLTREAEANILGGEATMWSELVVPSTIDSRIWPRTAAIAERLWSPGGVRNVDEMYRRLPFVSLDLERLGLGHIKNREALMRNLVNGYDIGSLKRLADVAEPLEGYERNPAGKIYEFHYAFNRFADITLADAPDARAFDLLVKRYQLTKRIQTKDSIRTILEEWRDNHNEILTIIEASPALAEVVDLSENLKNISIIGLEALELKSKEMTIDQRKAWYQSAMKALDSAREQVARTQLQVIDAISNLIKFETAQISAIKASDEIIIDGNLEEWNKVKWDYFLPLLNRGWNDTCFYAAQWDDQRLYFAFKVTNDNLQAHKRYRDEEGLHLDDGVEILFDTDHDGSLEWNKDDIAYHVNILNAIMDDKGLNDQGQYDNSWNGNAETYVKVLGTINDAKDDDEGYWVEFSIDWEELGREPEPNLTLGVNVCVNDTDDLHQEYRYYDYMGLSVFHHPAGFADLVLVE